MREKHFALRTLSLLSKKSNELYLPHLWSDLILRTEDLHCFFNLQKRVPDCGKFVRHLRFLNFSQFKGSRTVTVQSLPDGSLDPSAMSKAILEADTIQGSRNLEEFDQAIFGHAKHTSTSTFRKRPKFNLQLHKERCSVARGVIINSLLNLQTFFSTGDVAFPFCSRIGQNFSTLIGLCSNLKLLTIDRKVGQDHVFNAANAAWLICLPKLLSAQFCFVIQHSDVKLIQGHASAFSKRKSQIAILSLELVGMEENVNPDAVEDIFKAIISIPQALKTLSMNTNECGHLALQGLGRSTNSLVELTLEGSLRKPFPLDCLSVYSNVKTILLNLDFIRGLERVVGLAGELSSKPQVFPPVLETLRLKSNFWQSDEEVKMMMRENDPQKMLPDSLLASIISQVLIPSTLKKVTSNCTFDPPGEQDSASAWEKGILELSKKELEVACSQNNILLIFDHRVDTKVSPRENDEFSSSGRR